MISPSSAHELPVELLVLGGYAVGEDADQPGLFVWTYQENGQVRGGGDTSFPTAEEAWAEVREVVAEVLCDEADLPADAWNALAAEDRRRVILEQFG